jgi:hypothetical protein
VFLSASIRVFTVIPNLILRADSLSIARRSGQVRREGHRVDFGIYDKFPREILIDSHSPLSGCLLRSFNHSDGTPIWDPPLRGQQSPRKAPASQPDPKAVVKKVALTAGTDDSIGGGSVASVKAATIVAATVAAKKAAKVAAAKEVAIVKKAVEAATVKKAAEEATAKEATEATNVKKTIEEAAARSDAEEAFDSTPALG